jgi:hypothetical protein
MCISKPQAIKYKHVNKVYKACQTSLNSTEQKLLMQPFSFTTRCFTLPDLYAGKMHALTFRAWKNRIKGRDWYDLTRHLEQRLLPATGRYDYFIIRNLEVIKKFFIFAA